MLHNLKHTHTIELNELLCTLKRILLLLYFYLNVFRIIALRSLFFPINSILFFLVVVFLIFSIFKRNSNEVRACVMMNNYNYKKVQRSVIS